MTKKKKITSLVQLVPSVIYFPILDYYLFVLHNSPEILLLQGKAK